MQILYNHYRALHRIHYNVFIYFSKLIIICNFSLDIFNNLYYITTCVKNIGTHNVVIQIDRLSYLREWLSGGVSPCQGEGRGFESRLALNEKGQES